MSKAHQEIHENLVRDGHYLLYGQAYSIFTGLIRSVAGKPSLELTNDAAL